MHHSTDDDISFIFTYIDFNVTEQKILCIFFAYSMLILYEQICKY